MYPPPTPPDFPKARFRREWQAAARGVYHCSMLGSSRAPSLVSATTPTTVAHGSPFFRIAGVHTLADSAVDPASMSCHGLIDDHDEGRVGAVVQR